MWDYIWAPLPREYFMEPGIDTIRGRSISSSSKRSVDFVSPPQLTSDRSWMASASKSPGDMPSSPSRWLIYREPDDKFGTLSAKGAGRQSAEFQGVRPPIQKFADCGRLKFENVGNPGSFLDKQESHTAAAPSLFTDVAQSSTLEQLHNPIDSLKDVARNHKLSSESAFENLVKQQVREVVDGYVALPKFTVNPVSGLPPVALSSTCSESVQWQKAANMGFQASASGTGEGGTGTFSPSRNDVVTIDNQVSPVQADIYTPEACLITPPQTPGLDLKEQQAYFEELSKFVHPSVAREHFQRKQGVLWEGARLALMSHFLHPAELTESEFVALVCSQGNDTHSWLASNAAPIAHRSIRKSMDAQLLLSGAGIAPGIVDADFLGTFQWMSLNEQQSCITELHKMQLKYVAYQQRSTLTANDIAAFIALPVTTRASFLKQCLSGHEHDLQLYEKPVIDSKSLVNARNHALTTNIETLPEFEHCLSVCDSLVRTTSEHIELSVDKISMPVTQHDVDARCHRNWDTQSTEKSIDKTANSLTGTDGAQISSPHRSDAVVELEDAAAILDRNPPAYEVEHHCLPANNEHSSPRRPTINFAVASDVNDRKESIDSGIGMSSTRASNGSQQSCDSGTESEICFKGRKNSNRVANLVTAQKRKLTPIPDYNIDPYEVVRFHPSCASTASLDTVMLGISRMQIPDEQDSEGHESDSGGDNCSVLRSVHCSDHNGATYARDRSSRDESSWRLKPLGLRKKLSQTLRELLMVTAVDEMQDAPQTLRRKMSRAWGSLSLGSRQARESTGRM